MKIFKILLFVIGVNFACIAQEFTHENLYVAAEFEKDARILMEKMIDALATKTPDVPANKWADIKSKLDYSEYKERMVGVLKKHYTDDEVKRIFLQNDMLSPINDTGLFIFKGKESATEDMYNEGKIAGREIMQQVVILLKQGW